MDILIRTAAGNTNISRLLEHIPPLGMIIPAKQDAPCVLSTSRSLSSLFSSHNPSIPDNTECHAGGIVYAYHSGNWYDTTNYILADTVVISGAVTFRNTSNDDLEVTW